MIIGDSNGFAMTTGQRFCHIRTAAAVHRTDGMNHVFGSQPAAACEHGFSSRQRANLTGDLRALLQNGGTARAMNGAVYPSAA